jgi:hypothetical protein
MHPDKSEMIGADDDTVNELAFPETIFWLGTSQCGVDKDLTFGGKEVLPNLFIGVKLEARDVALKIKGDSRPLINFIIF